MSEIEITNNDQTTQSLAQEIKLNVTPNQDVAPKGVGDELDADMIEGAASASEVDSTVSLEETTAGNTSILGGIKGAISNIVSSSQSAFEEIKENIQNRMEERREQKAKDKIIKEQRREKRREERQKRREEREKRWSESSSFSEEGWAKFQAWNDYQNYGDAGRARDVYRDNGGKDDDPFLGF